MNLAWIAAVLEPLDVALNPHFPDDEYDSTGPARLAATVLGRQWRGQLEPDASEAEPRDLVDLAQGCLRNDLIAESVPQLAAALIQSPPADRAESAALALIVASASGELDDYGTCLMVLDSQLSTTQKEATADDALLTAILLQQKALRMRDAGKPHLAVSVEAGRVLSNLVIERCSPFRMGPSVSHSPYLTLARMRDGLVHAISSLIPSNAPERQEVSGLQTRKEHAFSQEDSVAARTARGRASSYAEYVRNSFTREFDTRSRVVTGGTGYVDLFPNVLLSELFGDGAVYPARRELALSRLLQSDGREIDLADALRLLRQAAAKNDLALVLRRLRDAGPLSAISRDGRQILQRRRSPELLRTVELQVLEAAADLLTPAEARLGLEAIKASLAAGGPPDLPGMWQLAVLRREVAWRAAAALANTCGAAVEVSDMLLAEVKAEHRDHQLFDTAVRRALSVLDWEPLPEHAKEAWAAIMLSHHDRLPRVANVIADRLDRMEPLAADASPLDITVHQINLALKGQMPDPAHVEGAELVRELLESIRSQAAQGSYSFGGVDPGDIAAALVIATGSRGLWDSLVGFLTDMRVPRDARTSAFERLARANVLIPQGPAELFRTHAQRLLYGESSFESGSPVFPYPAALRFLAACELLQDVDVYDAVAALAGGRSAVARREAAVTAAVLATKRPLPALLALILPLAGDKNPEVRAVAGGALVLLQSPGDYLSVVAGRRIVDLLSEDGILVPMVVLRELSDVSGPLSSSLRRRVEEVAERHNSRIVRARAKEVVRQSSQR
ncbi:hypothetical protein [Micromonospora zamorensis]|uniref:hypothetical protein n=1 Tax=Micromonospora zamorensis TaxID=709883 RepID=UPI003796D6E8